MPGNPPKALIPDIFSRQDWLLYMFRLHSLKLKARDMKKIFTILALIIASLGGLKAQTTLTQAVDFTVTDLNSTSHNLFSLLGSGKYVCLDFFFTTCPPCQATVPYFKQTFTNYGCNQGQIYFMSIDNGDNNALVTGYETTYIGGPSGFPVVSGVEGGGSTVCSAYGITAYPTYILIAPNHSIIEQDMWPISSSADFDAYFSAHALAQQPCPTSIAEQEELFDVTLFPNPASNVLTIQTTAALNSYQVVDALGKEVAAESLTQGPGRFEINIANLESGIYFITVTGADGKTARTKFQKI